MAPAGKQDGGERPQERQEELRDVPGHVMSRAAYERLVAQQRGRG